MSVVVVIGSGGHARVVIDALRAAGEHRIFGAVDVPERAGTHIDGIEVVTTHAELASLASQGVTAAVLGVGSVGDASTRVRLAEQLREAGLELPAIVHPTAYVSDAATLSAGVFVAAKAVVGVGASVGEFAIVNTGAVVDHDCSVGAFVHVAPGCAISGTVSIGDRAHLGTGASVIQGVAIGEGSVIGAGSVVLDDVPAGVMAWGNPCRVVREVAR